MVERLAIDSKRGRSQWWSRLFAVRRQRADLGARSMAFIIFVGTFTMAVSLTSLILYSHFILGHHHELTIFAVCCLALVYLSIVGLFIRLGRQASAAWLLIIFYGLVAGFIVTIWSINVPAGILLLAFTIILAGVLLGARYIIPVTIGVTLLLVAVQIATTLNIIDPDTTHLANEPSFGDVAGYGTIFIVFAIVMWLSRLRLEQALRRALRAEKALEKEKESLASRLEEKTRHLKEAQLEEMRQLYRFSELGQSSTALLHELANHLAVITLDMDAIDQRHQHSEGITHAKQSIAYLDRKIRELRQHLNESAAPQRFAIHPLMKELVDHLAHKSASAQVRLKLQTYGPRCYTRGDPQKLFQAMTILVTNAIEASSEAALPRRVLITIDCRHNSLKISVTDHGTGISTAQRRRLFKPFTSTKKNGMGIGLFIAQQIIETHMAGTLRLDPRRDQTTFVVTLPEDREHAVE